MVATQESINVAAQIFSEVCASLPPCREFGLLFAGSLPKLEPSPVDAESWLSSLRISSLEALVRSLHRPLCEEVPLLLLVLLSPLPAALWKVAPPELRCSRLRPRQSSSLEGKPLI
jgi:hypothetical protein